jgi:hypothetical protein
MILKDAFGLTFAGDNLPEELRRANQTWNPKKTWISKSENWQSFETLRFELR